ncbi:hypothetical protein [Aeromicrobium sp.]|uniref:hypothetical protein n=1 Tax=Aeromicrobium sp. TaxID=1871063 RepID=UPI003D6A7D4A
MPTDLVLLVVTSLFALMALVAAIVTIRSARRTTEVESAVRESAAPAVAPERLPRQAVLVPIDDDDVVQELVPRRVEGRVVVPPSGQQVVNAAMSRPHVRLAILAHGITYALRPESRDRITALMRREFRRRRRERLSAGRRAVRTARPASADSWMGESWIGELPAQSHSAQSHSSTRVDS